MLVKKEAKRNERRLNRQQDRQDTKVYKKDKNDFSIQLMSQLFFFCFKVCFKCRQSGHSVQECPSIKKDSEQGTGICYKCGSTEHALRNCKVKVAPGINL